MVQELLDMQTGRVYRRAGDGEWEEQFVDEGGEVAALLGNAPYVRAQASNMRLYTYSAIVSVAGSQCVLLSDAQIRGIIGRSFNVSNDCAAVMNGDWDNSGHAMVCAVYDSSSKSLNMRCKEYGTNSSDINGTMRINIVIATR